MERPARSQHFDSFVRNVEDHTTICRSIGAATASIADTVARTRQTIKESRALLNSLAHLTDGR